MVLCCNNPELPPIWTSLRAAFALLNEPRCPWSTPSEQPWVGSRSWRQHERIQMLNSECVGHHSTFHGLTFIKLCVRVRVPVQLLSSCRGVSPRLRLQLVHQPGQGLHLGISQHDSYSANTWPFKNARHQSGRSGLDKSALALLISIFCISSSCRILSP